MLLEDLQSKYQYSDVIKMIASECQPFLRQITDKLVFRGMNIKPNKLIYEQSSNRNPVSTPHQLHNRLNHEFNKKFGINYRNGVFASGSISRTNAYGTSSAVIFPIGDFDFCWSPSYGDLFVQAMIADPMITSIRNKHPDDKDLVYKLISEYVVTKYKDTDLDEAINSQNEIMFNCPNGYYAINYLNVNVPDYIDLSLRKDKVMEQLHDLILRDLKG